MKKRGLGLLRIVLPVAILAWLFYDVHRQDPDAIPRLLTRPKNTWLLGASLGCLLIATCLSFIRWFMLVRALDIPFTLRAAFRLGFLGYLLNFVGPGAVGGDVFKAYFVARNQRSRRAEAVATILLDRIVGLYSLLVVASVAISLPASFAMPKLAQFLQIVQWLTIGGAVVIVILMLPAKFSHWLVDPLLRVRRRSRGRRGRRSRGRRGRRGRRRGRRRRGRRGRRCRGRRRRRSRCGRRRGRGCRSRRGRRCRSRGAKGVREPASIRR